MKRLAFAMAVALLVVGCTGIPQGLDPVADFDVTRYAGTWFEIARLDHRFERGLSNVSATYILRSNERDGIKVVNQGFETESGDWKKITGKAFLMGKESGAGRLKVSFFGPFYGAYNIIYLDPDYQHAIVCGPNRSYLWILARRREIPEPTLTDLVQRAHQWGFDTNRLIYVEQDRDLPAHD